VASLITGGHRARKYHLSSQRLGDWLIGIVILGVIAAIAIPNLLAGISRSPQKRTIADMRAIGTALGSYQVDYDKVPSTYNVLWPLPELIEADGFVPSSYYYGSLYDGWGGPYYYVSNGVSYTIVSFGKDKKPGSTEDFTEDIRFVNGALQDIVKGNFFH
jgi:general secretion pathway protein G